MHFNKTTTTTSFKRNAYLWEKKIESNSKNRSHICPFSHEKFSHVRIYLILCFWMLLLVLCVLFICIFLDLPWMLFTLLNVMDIKCNQDMNGSISMQFGVYIPYELREITNLENCAYLQIKGKWGDLNEEWKNWWLYFISDWFRNFVSEHVFIGLGFSLFMTLLDN